MDEYQQRQRSQSVYETLHREMPAQEREMWQFQPEHQQRTRRMSDETGQRVARTIAAQFPPAGAGPEPGSSARSASAR